MALLLRGEARLRLGQTAEAIADLTQAMGRDAGLHEAGNDRAIAHFILGNRDDALADLDRVLAAQSLLDDLVLVTNDAALSTFGVKTLW